MFTGAGGRPASAIEDTSADGPGQPPYQPRLTVTLPPYAYSTGT